jgi:SAM-dependent methyltransferase
MFEFHGDRKRYFDIQYLNAKDYVLPFIEGTKPLEAGMRILDIGCGEGGVLKAFTERGCNTVGVEFDQIRIDMGKQWLASEIEKDQILFISKDIYDIDAEKDMGGHFDIIILKDVIEHIHDQAKLIQSLKILLKKGGYIFFGFPPWQMPFGGHQQICKNKWLSKIPYYHLLPRSLYKLVLKAGNENIDELMEIRDTRLSIEQFEKIVKKTGYTISQYRHYLINPIYKWKFNLQARAQFQWLQKIPYVRNFFTTCVYYLIQPHSNKQT